MSSQWAERPFHCSNDCRQAGCPGHVARLNLHHTSDTVQLEVDGQCRTVFDKVEWAVFCDLAREIRERG